MELQSRSPSDEIVSMAPVSPLSAEAKNGTRSRRAAILRAVIGFFTCSPSHPAWLILLWIIIPIVYFALLLGIVAQSDAVLPAVLPAA
jgi:hypothetical protein